MEAPSSSPTAHTGDKEGHAAVKENVESMEAADRAIGNSQVAVSQDLQQSAPASSGSSSTPIQREDTEAIITDEQRRAETHDTAGPAAGDTVEDDAEPPARQGHRAPSPPEDRGHNLTPTPGWFCCHCRERNSDHVTGVESDGRPKCGCGHVKCDHCDEVRRLTGNADQGVHRWPMEVD